MVVDRTERFRSIAAKHASSKNKSKLFSPKSDPYLKECSSLLKRIMDVETLLRSSEEEYTNRRSRVFTDDQRDDLDSNTRQFVEEGLQSIEHLKSQATEFKKAQHRAFGLGVVLILNDRLQGIVAVTDRLKVFRARQARAPGRRGEHTIRVPKNISFEHDPSEMKQTLLNKQDEHPLVPAHVPAAKQELLAAENTTLNESLNVLVTQVRETERTIHEIGELSHLLSCKVSEQAEEINHLYDLAVETSLHVEKGVEELEAAKKKGGSVRVALFVFIMMASITLLFLEFYG
eukprot:Rmarinus@m.12879